MLSNPGSARSKKTPGKFYREPCSQGESLGEFGVEREEGRTERFIVVLDEGRGTALSEEFAASLGTREESREALLCKL